MAVRRALVLGGGGVTGIGWEIGVLHGLLQAGVDLTAADVVIGTSAGSVVGAQITSGMPLADLYDRQLAPPDGEIGATLGPATLARMVLPMLLPGSATTRRRRVGRAALRAHPESADARLAVIRGRLASTTWPDRDLRVTAVAATTGESRVFDRDSGVDLVHAVAASCAVPMVWPPVPIDGVPYVDGGVRSPTNADLAAGADRVVVLAPLLQAATPSGSATAQLARLGARVRSGVLSPDAAAKAAIGRNVLDPAHRADAARAGVRQGVEVADRVREVWSAD